RRRAQHVRDRPPGPHREGMARRESAGPCPGSARLHSIHPALGRGMPNDPLREPSEPHQEEASGIASNVEVPMQRRRERDSPRGHKSAAASKLFVLDTNVLMHDPTSLFRFEEHDVFLPMVTLEELDDNKKGMSEVARNARQASRFLDEIVRQEGDIEAGYSLKVRSSGEATGNLFLQTHS